MKLEEGIAISPETIYKHVWRDKRAGGLLYKDLRHSGKRYNKRSSTKNGRGCIPDRVGIAERPVIVEAKSRIGDWEGDLIIGAKHDGAVMSYVDRKSKFTVLKRLAGKKAEIVTEATVDSMSDLLHPVLTITYDNGKEFASHKIIAEKLKAKCYFANPYHSWERGLNEHTNGLVRQYLPKKTRFSEVTDEEVQAIAERLNNRPRKVLEYRTPAEIFFTEKISNCGVALGG